MSPITAIEQQAIRFLYQTPGLTTAELARLVNVKDTQNGLQKAASWAVVSLRKRGYLVDVEARCPHCGCAKTRGQKNIPLQLTDEGKRYAAGLFVGLPDAA